MDAGRAGLGYGEVGVGRLDGGGGLGQVVRPGDLGDGRRGLHHVQECPRGGEGDGAGDQDDALTGWRNFPGLAGEGTAGRGTGVRAGVGLVEKAGRQGVGEEDGGRGQGALVDQGDGIGHRRACGDGGRRRLAQAQVGPGEGIPGLGGAVQGISPVIVAVANPGGVVAPVGIGIGGGGVNALHRLLGRVIPGRPGAPVAVGRVHSVTPGIAQGQHLAGITQRAVVDLVGRDVNDGGIVGALQEKVAAGGDDAGEGDGDVAPVGEGPAGQVNGSGGVVVEFDPLVGGGGQCPHPGHLVDDDIARGPHLPFRARVRRNAGHRRPRYEEQEEQEADGHPAEYPLHRPTSGRCMNSQRSTAESRNR